MNFIFFFREASSHSLSVMCENVSVYRALTSVISGGLNHKGVAVRSEVARLAVLLVEALGATRVMGSSRDFQLLLVPSCAKMLTDGSLEVRTHTKKVFAELMRHEKFDVLLKETLTEQETNSIRKTLDTIK